MRIQERVFTASNGCYVLSVGRGFTVHNAQKKYIGESWTLQHAKQRAIQGEKK